MSANNYMLIQEVITPEGKEVCIWDNLNAEEAMENPALTVKSADKIFHHLSEAIAWANEHDETEYGYRINHPYKPKDGFKETIKGKNIKLL
jgi:hypothetical protein